MTQKNLLQKIYNKNYVLTLGIFINLIFYLVYLIQGENIIVDYHDQLDGEIVYYILKGSSFKNFFINRYDAFMNGEAAVTVPAFLSLLFYHFLSPVYAFITNMFVVRVIAFVSLYFVLIEFKVEYWISFLVAIVFSMLPIYSVYGLSSMGVGLVILAYKYLIQSKHIALSLFLVALYGLYSSVILTGFAVIGCMILTIFYLMYKKQNPVYLIIALGVLLFVYIITNTDIFTDLFHNASFTSHKTDIVLEPSSFIRNTLGLLINGQYHAVSIHRRMYIILFFSTLLCLSNKKLIENEKLKLGIFLYVIITLIAIFKGVFQSKIGITIREKLFSDSTLISFQFDRFYWLYPVLWYSLYGIMLSFVYKTLSSKYKIRICKILVVLLWCIPSVSVIKNSDIKNNILNCLNIKKGQQSTWKVFYEPELFSDIDNYIGIDKSEYKVVSVGMHPSILLYNGFYCIDGYSNNYNLKHKKEFYEIIKDEISKDEELYKYFVDWGNRCYMFSTQCGYNIPQSYSSISPQFNTSKLKEMGCKYIFSTVVIDNYKELNLSFINKFSNQDSLYDVNVYEVL